MIIDFHTHTFPKEIAARALARLSASECLSPFTDATNEGLLQSMDRSGVDISILLPVVTKLIQTGEINRNAALVEAATKSRLISFGGIHPDDEDYERTLELLKSDGVRGIKLHPVFQNTNFDDIRYKRIIYKACELGLLIMVHAGYDISMPNVDFASGKRIISVVKEIRPDKMILAHMGAWRAWDEAEEVVGEVVNTGADIYIDTSFALLPDASCTDGNNSDDHYQNCSHLDYKNCFYDTDIPAMKADQFCRIVRHIGADRVLFGTDSPWTDQKQSIDSIKHSGLTEEEIKLILGENAYSLLNLTKKLNKI